MTTDIAAANAELADWIDAAAETLLILRPGDGHWIDRITNLAAHIRAGRIGNPADAFNEIEEETR